MAVRMETKEGNGRFALIMEVTLVNAVTTIAAVAAVVRFALVEWEEVVRTWMRVSRSRRRGIGRTKLKRNASK